MYILLINASSTKNAYIFRHNFHYTTANFIGPLCTIVQVQAKTDQYTWNKTVPPLFHTQAAVHLHKLARV